MPCARRRARPVGPVTASAGRSWVPHRGPATADDAHGSDTYSPNKPRRKRRHRWSRSRHHPGTRSPLTCCRLPAGLAAGKSADAGPGQPGPPKVASATGTAGPSGKRFAEWRRSTFATARPAAATPSPAVKLTSDVKVLAPTVPWSCRSTTATCCTPTRPGVTALRNGALQLRGDRALGEVDHLRTIRAIHRAPDFGDQAVADEDLRPSPRCQETPLNTAPHTSADALTPRRLTRAGTGGPVPGEGRPVACG